MNEANKEYKEINAWLETQKSAYDEFDEWEKARNWALSYAKQIGGKLIYIKRKEKKWDSQ